MSFYLFKFIFQILCFGLLSYQFLDITNSYLSFPYEVRQEINDYNGFSLPSITFCLKRDNIWLKKNYKSKKNSFTHFLNWVFKPGSKKIRFWNQFSRKLLQIIRSTKKRYFKFELISLLKDYWDTRSRPVQKSTRKIHNKIFSLKSISDVTFYSIIGPLVTFRGYFKIPLESNWF